MIIVTQPYNVYSMLCIMYTYAVSVWSYLLHTFLSSKSWKFWKFKNLTTILSNYMYVYELSMLLHTYFYTRKYLKVCTLCLWSVLSHLNMWKLYSSWEINCCFLLVFFSRKRTILPCKMKPTYCFLVKISCKWSNLHSPYPAIYYCPFSAQDLSKKTN